MARISIRLRGIGSTFRELNEDITEEVAEDTRSEAGELYRNLQAATPVDTGFARSSWRVSRVTRGFGRESEIIIENTAEYIDDLNRGSSRQAPARFIENTVLRQDLTPVGSIVTDRPGGRRRP